MGALAITGASGFIGRHLIRSLLEKPEIEEIRILTRAGAFKDITPTDRIRFVHGDLLKSNSLLELVTSGCTLVNLAYLSTGSASDNLLAAENLAAVCRRASVKRLIHCSTAVVVGASSEDFISETTVCRPKNAYEKTKLAIEKALYAQSEDSFELAILRPTAVFGPGGTNLLKLANNLTCGNRWANHLKSCLYHKRKMNLVAIGNVTAAIVFLIDIARLKKSEIFIISDDEDPLNNFRDVERFLKKRLNSPNERMPRIPFPKQALRLVLMLAGKSSSNPDRIYSSEKIISAGFNKPMPFEDGLTLFSDWYRNTFLNPSHPNRKVY